MVDHAPEIPALHIRRRIRDAHRRPVPEVAQVFEAALAQAQALVAVGQAGRPVGRAVGLDRRDDLGAAGRFGIFRVRSRRERRAGPVLVVDRLVARIFQHHARIERGAIGLQRDIVSRFDARRARPELPRRRGICEIVFQRHRHRHFTGTLLHHLEIPRLQPRLAVLGIRERGEDAAIHHQPVVIKIAALDPVRHADFRAIKLFVAGRLVNDGKNAPAKFGQERYLQITILEHVGPERAIDDGLLVERPADESVLRIGRVVHGAPRHRRLAERHSVGHRRRRVRDGIKHTDRPKCCNRETDPDTRGSLNCHLRRLRMRRSDNSSTSTRPAEAGLIGSPAANTPE